MQEEKKRGNKRKDVAHETGKGTHNSSENVQYSSYLDDASYRKINKAIKDLKFLTPRGILKYLKKADLSPEERRDFWWQLGKMYEEKGVLRKAGEWYGKVGDEEAIAEMYEKAGKFRTAAEYWASSVEGINLYSPETARESLKPLQRAISNYQTYEAKHPFLNVLFDILDGITDKELDLEDKLAIARDTLRGHKKRSNTKRKNKSGGLEMKTSVIEIIVLFGLFILGGIIFSTNLTGMSIANLSQTSLNYLGIGIFFFIFLVLFFYIKKRKIFRKRN